MDTVLALAVVLVIALVAWLGALESHVRLALAVALPAGAASLFLVGIVRRVMAWARSPVPFRIPVTCGQQASFEWLKPNRLDNPSTLAGVIGRMALEVLLFRSLFRNARAERRGDRLIFRGAGALWLAALAFHYSMLLVVLRHLRFVTAPVPGFVNAVASADSFLRVGVPALYTSDVVLVGAIGYLLVRRLRDPQLRYLSLFGDYFLPLIVLAVATTGILMRYVVRVDTIAVKELAMSLVTFSSPKVAGALHPLVFVHLALVAVLVASLPFTKLVHMAGVFLSPTRTLANNNRARRHVNPWNHPVRVHGYEAWEQEFRDKLIAAGLPVEGREDHV